MVVPCRANRVGELCSELLEHQAHWDGRTAQLVLCHISTTRRRALTSGGPAYGSNEAPPRSPWRPWAPPRARWQWRCPRPRDALPAWTCTAAILHPAQNCWSAVSASRACAAATTMRRRWARARRKGSRCRLAGAWAPSEALLPPGAASRARAVPLCRTPHAWWASSAPAFAAA